VVELPPDGSGGDLEMESKTKEQLIEEVESLRKEVDRLKREKAEGKKAEAALKESAEKYKSLVNNVKLGVFRSTTGPDGGFLEVNPAMEEITGYSREELLRMSVSGLYVRSEERGAVLGEIAAAKGKTVTKELKFRRKDGTEIVISDMKVAVRDNAGQVQYFDGIIEDITERKKAEEKLKASLEEKEVLLKEIHHRVKNNLQVISSLLNLQSGYIEDERYAEMFKESQNRVRSMALVHEKLYQSKDLVRIDLAGYIESMVQELRRAYGAEGARIAVKAEVDDIRLGVDQAMPCGLIINELVSNCMKHAFSQREGGEIRIAMRQVGGDEVELEVSDNGAGISEGMEIRNAETLGLRLVSILAEDQLGGEMELDRTEGTRFRIRFRVME